MSKPFDPTKPVQTRDGRKVEITQLKNDANYTFFGNVFELDVRVSKNESWMENGQYDRHQSDESDWDLVNVPESMHVAPRRTLESLRLDGFKIEVSNGDQLGTTKYKHRVLLSKDGASAQSNCDELQHAIDRAYEMWLGVSVRDYTVVLNVFDDGVVSTGATVLRPGAKLIARKEITFQARPGDVQ